MFVLVGILIGLNLCVRIVLGEARERELAGRVGTRGESRLRIEDYLSIAWRGLLFLLVPVALGLLADTIFGTGLGAVFAD